MRSIERILVTGGAGFIGSAFICWLMRQPHFQGYIINLDALTYAGNLNLLKTVSSHPRYRFVRGNILDLPLVTELVEQERIDTIVHFAAETHVDRSIASSEAFVETNIKGTWTLLEAVRKFSRIHFHHVSTDEVYGSLGEDGFFNEQSPYRPNSPYAASKAASDHLVRAFTHTYRLSTTLSHCSNNYGPGQVREKLIPLMIENTLEKQLLPVYGRGINVRDWLYVDDHAEGIWRILTMGKSGETYDLGGGAERSNLALLHELLAILSEETGEDARSLIRFVTDRPGHDFRYAIDASKSKLELGWAPRTALQEGLRKTVRWHIAQRELERIA